MVSRREVHGEQIAARKQALPLAFGLHRGFGEGEAAFWKDIVRSMVHDARREGHVPRGVVALLRVEGRGLKGGGPCAIGGQFVDDAVFR